MAGSFEERTFADINLGDPFFDSLRADYDEFDGWFRGKASDGATALIVEDEGRILAFLYLKPNESEEIELSDRTLPAEPRMKIGTLKIANEAQGTRLGEGAVGLALWHWRDSKLDQVYVTAFPKQGPLRTVLERFGFTVAGEKPNGELVMMKDRRRIDYTDGYLSFPFIDPNFEESYLLPIEAEWHDQLFPYSELQGVSGQELNIAAGNGVSKVYLAFSDSLVASPGRPILIYRKSDTGTKRYTSAVTSFGLITGVTGVKSRGNQLRSLDELYALVRNKSVFTDEEVADWYQQQRNLTAIEVLYLGFFGAGRNVNYDALDYRGLFPAHPYQVRHTPQQFRQILDLGRFDVESVIVDQS